MRFALGFLAFVACKGEVDDSGKVDTETTDTDTTPIPSSISAHCDPDPSGNELRFVCTVDLEPPGPVELVFSPTDGSRPERLHIGQDRVWMFFMAPQTEYNWRVISQEDPELAVQGTVTTGNVPGDARIFAATTGTSSASMFLTSSPCTGATTIVVDPQGTVLWYQDLAQMGVTPPLLEIVTHTEDDTVIGISSEFVVEVDWTGAALQVLTPGFDNDTRIHHDVFKRDGHTFTLFQESIDLGGDTTVLDGFYVYDPAGDLVATWRLIDHWSPPVPPVGNGGIVDYSHANSIFVQEDGDILLSFRHMSAIAKIRGDWTQPDFGEILWRLSGDPDEAPFGSDFSLTASMGSWPGFVHQHNVHPLPDGRLAMFDNRKQPPQLSRVLVLDVDELGGTANVDLAYELDRLCAFQGSAWHTAAGNPLATCAPPGELSEFAANIVTEPIYELSIACATGASHYTSRFVPLEL